MNFGTAYARQIDNNIQQARGNLQTTLDTYKDASRTMTAKHTTNKLINRNFLEDEYGECFQ